VIKTQPLPPAGSEQPVRDAQIVQEDVEPPVFLVDPLDEGAYLGLVEMVGGNRDSLPPAAVTSSALPSMVSVLRPTSLARVRVVRPVTYTVAPVRPFHGLGLRPAPRVAPATSAIRPASGPADPDRAVLRVPHCAVRRVFCVVLSSYLMSSIVHVITDRARQLFPRLLHTALTLAPTPRVVRLPVESVS
jgi:hypothetical protein